MASGGRDWSRRALSRAALASACACILVACAKSEPVGQAAPESTVQDSPLTAAVRSATTDSSPTTNQAAATLIVEQAPTTTVAPETTIVLETTIDLETTPATASTTVTTASPTTAGGESMTTTSADLTTTISPTSVPAKAATTTSEHFLDDLRASCAEVLAFDDILSRYNNRLTVEMFQETGPTVLKLWELMAQWEEATKPRIFEITSEFYRDLLDRLDTLDQADPDKALSEAIRQFYGNADELNMLADEIDDLDIDGEQVYYGFLTPTAAELAPNCGQALRRAEDLLIDSV